MTYIIACTYPFWLWVASELMFKLIKELTFNKFPAVSFTVYFIHAVNNYSGLAVLRQHAIQYYCMHGYSIYFLVVDTMQERTENVLACIYQFPGS